MNVDKDAIDALTSAFFRAFTNDGGTAPNIDGLYELFIPQAVIVNNVKGSTQVYDVRGFIEPRREILTNGSLTDFREWEVSERTEIFANIAHRFSRYEKSWMAGGQPHAGAGAKSIQFARTPAGWKIAALIWDDAD